MDTLHLGQQVQEYRRFGDEARKHAIRTHRERLSDQLRAVMTQAEDVKQYCNNNYGTKFRVTFDDFEFTVQRVTFNGGSGWIAVTQNPADAGIDGSSLPWHVLNDGRLIAETEHDFPVHFRPYLPRRECERVTFSRSFLDGGARVVFRALDNDHEWLPQFQAQALVGLSFENGEPELPNLAARPACFVTWRPRSPSWMSVARQAVAVCDRATDGVRLPRHTVTGQPLPEMDLWYLTQLGCPPVTLSPQEREVWQAARNAAPEMTRALKEAADVFDRLSCTQRELQLLSPGISIGENAHTPPLGDLLDEYGRAILIIQRKPHGWYLVDVAAPTTEVWLSDQPSDFDVHMQRYLPVVDGTEQAFWRHNERGGVTGHWMVPSDALSEICCSGRHDDALGALTASYVGERQVAQQRAAATVAAFQPAQELPGATPPAAVFQAENADLETACKSARDDEWEADRRVILAGQLAASHKTGGKPLSDAMRQHTPATGPHASIRVGHSGRPSAQPACKVDGTANNAGMGSSCGIDVVARAGDGGSAVLELHLPISKDGVDGSELCAILDPKLCAEPQVLAPPGYTGKDKTVFLDKTAKYLANCLAYIIDAHAEEVAQQLDEY